MSRPARSDGLAARLRPLLDTKVYKLTKYSVVFVLAILTLFPWEIVAVRLGLEGGPLTHVTKWIYGEPLALRWWLLGCTNWGFIWWIAPHFMLGDLFGFKMLVAFMSLGFALGLTGYFLTH